MKLNQKGEIAILTILAVIFAIGVCVVSTVTAQAVNNQEIEER